MRRRPTLAVFARKPAPGMVKRRLAAGIGDAAALRLYREMTARTLHRLARRAGWRLVLCVTPDAAVRFSRAWPRDVPRLAQGGGDLGARMERALRILGPGPVAIVGTDIPALSARHAAAAFAALCTSDAVFGVASDGGYWLVGLRRPVPGLFAAVRWSGEHALADTLANLPAHRSAALLEELDDLDDAADLARLSRRAGAP